MSHIDKIKRFFSENPSMIDRKWKKGEYLCWEGAGLERLSLLVSGRCRVFRDLNNGRTVLYRIYVPGSIMGDIELFSGGKASCSIQFITDAETVSVSMESVRTNKDRYSRLIFYLGRGLARKLHENSLSEALNTSYPLEVRLAHYYLNFTDSDLSASSLGQLAEWMGCSYRHLTRSLAALSLKGGIRKYGEGGGAGWEILDQSVLRKIAMPMLEEEGRILFEPGEPLEE
ncbi:MAG: cyclic nucleotide-binding domain-containing protein [Spirochaetales bacterium]|nr:cyclic nucleotide-binding domain-containing protein [Spirochaetales bacterium]